MAPISAGPHGRTAMFRPKSRPILTNASRSTSGRSPVAMPVRRIGGVGGPATGRFSGSGATTPPPPVDDAITLALETLELLQRRAHEVADAFRWNRIAEANHGLSEIVQSTGTLLRL